MPKPKASPAEPPTKPTKPAETGGGAAFLLAQLGTHAANRFAERMADIGLTPAQAGILRSIANDPGSSQQRLATRLGVLASTMVTLVDGLDAQGLVRRERSGTDRRQYALDLTDQGRAVMRRIGQAARAHDRDICTALDESERIVLIQLLGRVRDQQGLTPGVHPGYRQLRSR